MWVGGMAARRRAKPSGRRSSRDMSIQTRMALDSSLGCAGSRWATQSRFARDSHRLKYRVTSVEEVAKKALATESQAFQQTGPHRLVLITCTGDFHRDRGGYDSNLVVVAKPLGLAR